MDFFVVNGKIWQGKGQFCQALLVLNGRISAAGEAERLEPYSKGCQLLDCGGRTVIPGIIDPYGTLPEPPPRKGLTDWLEGQLHQLARAGVTAMQWPDWEGNLTKQILPALQQLIEKKPLPRLQLLTRKNHGWQKGFGGRLTRVEELPGLWRQGGQLLVSIPDQQTLERFLHQLQFWPLPEGNPRRLTLIGANCTDSGQLQKLGELGVGILGFPAQLEDSLLQCAGQPGAQIHTCCAWRTLSHLGAKVAFAGTNRVEPFAGLQKAVCRTTVTVTGQSQPSREALTVEEGLEAMTAGAAWMDFQEDFSGRLLPGYRADLLVLNDDPFTCPKEALRTLRPVLTMVDGNLLWREI